MYKKQVESLKGKEETPENYSKYNWQHADWEASRIW